MSSAAHRQPPIPQVAAGMPVIDAGGVVIGTVDRVELGDPHTVTVQLPVGGTGGSLTDLAHATAVEEPDVPADVEARLRRSGYLKVDGHPQFEGAVYVEAGQISGVRDGMVRLNVVVDELTAQE